MAYNVLPSQTGKLPSEPDGERFFGLELEFNPDGLTIPDYRVKLHEHEGVDTFDDACRYVTRRRQQGGARHGPAGLRAVPECSTDTCGGRPDHVVRLLENMPEAVSALSQISRDRGVSIPRAFNNASGVSNTRRIREWLGELFPRPDDPRYRFWDLGTDPTAGFELRSPPLTIGEGGLDAVRGACAALSRGGAVPTSACGVHVHMDVNDESDEQAARLFALYKFTEPLLAAPIHPSRYYKGYNAPLWRAVGAKGEPDFEARDLDRIKKDKNALRSYEGGWLRTRSIRTHGTYEFRGLEGTLDYDLVRMYILFLNRFMQAGVADKSWGVRLSGITPIGYDSDAREAFLSWLDLDRDGLGGGLSDLREWYLERVSKFESRNAFRNSLVRGTHKRTEKFVDLGELRTTGKVGDIQLIEEALDEASDKDLSDKELGLVVYDAIENTMAGSSTSTPSRRRNRGNIRDSILKLLRDVPRRYAGYDVFESGDVQEAVAEGLISAAQGEILDQWELFVEALLERDFERLGAWYREYCLGNENAITALARYLNFWCGAWASRYPDASQIGVSLKGGDGECVDF